MTLDIIYQDNHFVAINKPARLPVASDASGDETLLEQVRQWNTARQVEGRKGYCVPIHFLDRPVSGIVLFAISSKAATRLNEIFRSRQIKKEYLAVIECHPSKLPSGRIETWLSKDHDQNLTSVSTSKDPEAKRSILTVTPQKSLSAKTHLVLVQPETGRSHQIRAQLASVGCPIYGDVKYGGSRTWHNRIALHAWRLSFAHPVGKELLSFECKLPDYWQELGAT
jgi:23S rRNA pseudouridine1911/1915/1917 synthase